MKNNYFLFLIFTSCLFFMACNSDDSGENPSLSLEVKTLSAQVEEDAVLLRGEIVNDGGSSIQMRGICWAVDELPVRYQTNYKEDYLNQTGVFEFLIEYGLEPNTLYQARAYATNESGQIVYGNVISFQTDNIGMIQTLNPKDISTTQATLRGKIMQNPTETTYVQFVYSTNPNPTVNNQTTFAYVTGSDTFEVMVENLNHSTTYYVRTVIMLNDNYLYGEQKEFKTAGYSGNAGGFVAFDKGEVSEGWRFLEIYPVTLNYDINQTTGSSWGTFDHYISGTSHLFGSGINNTENIVSQDPAENCAAKLCRNATIHSYSDWFLPSNEELLLIAKSLKSAEIMNIDNAWTSTQYDAMYGYSVYYNFTTQKHEIFAYNPKSYSNLKVYPVRRY